MTKSPALGASLRSLEKTMPKFDDAVVTIQRLAVTLDKNTTDLRPIFNRLPPRPAERLQKSKIVVKQMGITMKEVEGTVISTRAVIDLDLPSSMSSQKACARSPAQRGRYVF
jgi:hypothetical protein